MQIKSQEELEQKFQERIDRGEIIEPKDWMPERYRKQLIRMMSQHAHSEVVGMLPDGKQFYLQKFRMKPDMVYISTAEQKR